MNKALKIGGLIFVLVVILIFVIGFKNASHSLNQPLSVASPAGIPSYMSPLSGSRGNSLSTKELGGVYMDAVAPTEALTQSDMPQTEKKVIKNGNLSLKIDNADETLNTIDSIVRSHGGNIFSSNIYRATNDVKNGTVTVKVPVLNFDVTFSEIKKVAALVIQESTSGQDVTEQYVDLKAQLNNAQAEEQTFIRILDQAVKIDDVLAVTRELSRVRGSIEQLQGRIKYLESQTDMATITINLTENQNITVVDSWRPFQVIKDSVNALIQNLQGLIDFIIRFIVILLPLLLIWGVIIWGVYKIGKKAYLKAKVKNESL